MLAALTAPSTPPVRPLRVTLLSSGVVPSVFEENWKSTKPDWPLRADVLKVKCWESWAWAAGPRQNSASVSAPAQRERYVAGTSS